MRLKYHNLQKFSSWTGKHNEQFLSSTVSILAEGLQYSVQLQFSLMAAQLQHYSTFSYLLQLYV